MCFSTCRSCILYNNQKVFWRRAISWSNDSLCEIWRFLQISSKELLYERHSVLKIGYTSLLMIFGILHFVYGTKGTHFSFVILFFCIFFGILLRKPSHFCWRWFIYFVHPPIKNYPICIGLLQSCAVVSCVYIHFLPTFTCVGWAMAFFLFRKKWLRSFWNIEQIVKASVTADNLGTLCHLMIKVQVILNLFFRAHFNVSFLCERAKCYF